MGPQAKQKPVYKTAIPFTHTRWPKLTSLDRDNILDLLCSFLQPLGDHRRTHIIPSKGKKRKRKSKQPPNPDLQLTKEPSQDKAIQDAPPPPPEIGSYVLIGLNSVTRHLEALAAQNAPRTFPKSSSDGSKENSNDAAKGSRERGGSQPNIEASPLQPLSLVIIPHTHPPASLPHAHIPILIHLSTLMKPSSSSSSSSSSIAAAASMSLVASANSKATRLITLPPASEAQLASTLHVPHVGALAIKEGAPGADALVGYVREHVGLTECAWIDEAMSGEWKATKVDVGK
ncbi:hypothetical protein K458DRAFT_351426 [Lentithecium fluviatile CBS 122367]|uniref:RNase P subunit Pop3 n=1 Tax=Lentithecium fluviatile CBS 122367 TaxID=1168545 RepID=A0A6G1IEM0_9PLEO|nr:hypothetical protein K458DRAFT_351426 [Lentithecium fluviatile CBS 122367]